MLIESLNQLEAWLEGQSKSPSQAHEIPFPHRVLMADPRYFDIVYASLSAAFLLII